MDSVTQAVLGAGIQGALLGVSRGARRCSGGRAGDRAGPGRADALSRPGFIDDLSPGFSHSLFVLTGLAALLAWLIRRYWRQAPYGGRRLFLTLWLVLVTHPLLDAFTVYGTQLFWPLAPVPESWAAVFIIDPVYTVPLLAASLYAVAAGMTARARSCWRRRWHSARSIWVSVWRAGWRPNTACAMPWSRKASRSRPCAPCPCRSIRWYGACSPRRRTITITKPYRAGLIGRRRNGCACRSTRMLEPTWPDPRCTTGCAGSPATGCAMT